MTLKMRSGIRPGTHKSLFIGPGAIYKGFKSPTDLGVLMGATKGGNKISIKQEWHNAEIDGTLGPVKGARWLVGEEVEIETNLLEMTLENLKLQLPGAIIDSTDADYDVISQTDDIGLVDYYDIAIVGELVGKQKPIIFVIKNAIATEPLEVDTGNGKEDVVLKVKFVGHYTEDEPTTPPYKIYYPRAEVVADILPTAAPTLSGTAQVGETLTATSGYNDVDGDPEAGTTYEFYTYNVDGTTGESLVRAGSTSNTYVVQAADVGKVVKVKVIPRNNRGAGAVATSAATQTVIA